MAGKKKSAAKKVSKKADAKRVVKKAASRSVAKKSVAKKKTAKKSPAKRVAKKAVAKKAVAKKTPAKRVAKKVVAKKVVAKKAPAKRAVKKSAASPVTQRVSVSTTPVPPKPATPVAPKPTPPEIKPAAPKPVAIPRQNTSSRVVFLVVAGIVILAAIVWSKSGSDSDDAATPTPSISQSAEPTESATAEPTEPAAVVAVEAPSKFVALNSTDGLKLRWAAPSAVDGLTGYNVEVRANGAGDWMTIATVPADQLTQNVTKSSDNGWTQFRVSSVYSDGQIASSAVFGIPGEFS